jgi:hypothetical protein
MNKPTPHTREFEPKNTGEQTDDMFETFIAAVVLLIKWTFTLGIQAARSNWSLPDDDETIELAAAVPVGTYPTLEGNLRAKSWLGWGAAIICPVWTVTLWSYTFWLPLVIGWGLSFWLYRPWVRAACVGAFLIERENGTMDPRKEIQFDSLRLRKQNVAAQKALVGLPATVCRAADNTTAALLGTVVRDLNTNKQHLLEDWKADLNGIGIDATGLMLPSRPPHWIMVGESGSGKTESMKRIASAALEEGAQVFFIDGKGDAKTALEFQAIVQGAGKTVALWPDHAFDLFRGSAAGVLDRLSSLLLTTDEGSAAAYYDKVLSLLLQAVCLRPSGCPRNFADLLDGIDSAERTGEVTTAARLRKVTENPSGKQAVEGTIIKVQQLRVQLALMGGVDNDAGQRTTWSWDGACVADANGLTHHPIDAGYVRIDSASNASAAKGIARAIVKDFDQWARTGPGDRLEKNGAYPYSKQRFRDGRPVYLFLDEFSALSGAAAESLIGLLERARSSKVRVFMSVQSYIGLGRDNDDRRRITEAGVGIWSHRISNPEEITKLIGTEQVTEAGHQVGDGDMTGVSTMRKQWAYAVAPEDLKSLEVGEAIVGTPGVAVQVRVAQAVVPHTRDMALIVDAASEEVAQYHNHIYAEREADARSTEQAKQKARSAERAAPAPKQGQPAPQPQEPGPSISPDL